MVYPYVFPALKLKCVVVLGLNIGSIIPSLGDFSPKKTIKSLLFLLDMLVVVEDAYV
jgi:hypothetical protein